MEPFLLDVCAYLAGLCAFLCLRSQWSSRGVPLSCALSRKQIVAVELAGRAAELRNCLDGAATTFPVCGRSGGASNDEATAAGH